MQSIYSIELKDIQGYVVRGYKHMMYSRYVLLQVTSPADAKKFINMISGNLTNATHYPSVTCLNIAFTSEGLRALGMSENNMQMFSREFREGITSPQLKGVSGAEGVTTSHRQRLLGDFDSSAPANWRWGGPKTPPVHILLMVFGTDKATALDYYAQLQQQFSISGVFEIMQLDGQTLPFNKEHFGFRDGISQPVIKGSGRIGAANDYINPGEFLLGYKNEYDVFPDTPLLEEEQGNVNLLPADAAGSGKKDIGRNGSYLVLRQLQQDVDGYWNFLNERTKNEDGTVNVEESIRLGAKFMGRWPSGAPIAKFPDKDPLLPDDDDNTFTYSDIDKDGIKCPFGSHIRRANPRDNFEDDGPEESLRLTKRHRIIRRGRLYGDPIESTPLNHTPAEEVGLLFGCFNADISRQYEFIQYTWANYPKFRELYNDPDPIIGVREIPQHGQEQNFTIQDTPVSRCVRGLKKFVITKGGAYFFFPSITTVRYIASL